jgi:hypothetical protein
MGVIIVLGSVFARHWHLHNIYYLIYKKKQLLLETKSLIDIVLILISIICAQLVPIFFPFSYLPQFIVVELI